MEVGAVKQAFNNEVILLKRNVNQAKTQVIHKLTRKAKTLTEKKTPEHLKDKLKRKAESAVNEVLIIKKLKAQDIAKFIITHTGEVSDYLNRPKVDNDKACARLVLHKSLQEKYKFIRNRFGNIPIKDLFMSRQERRKLKKEAKEQQKNKKKAKESKFTNAAGDWNVEDVKIDISEDKIGSNDEISGDESIEDDRITGFQNKNDSDQDDSENDNLLSKIESSKEVINNKAIKSNEEVVNSDDDAIESDNDDTMKSDDDEAKSDNSTMQFDKSENESEDEEVGKLLKLKPINKTEPIQTFKSSKSSFDKIQVELNDFKTQHKQFELKANKTVKQVNMGKIDKKPKDNKNKNLKEKLQNRKFKKDGEDEHIEGRKVVDPFFITATGEKYLSLAEPRLPDEVKEVHKQGNRQERRAAMFGRKIYRRNDFREKKIKSDFDNNTSRGNNNSRFRNEDSNNSIFNERNSKFNDKNSKFNDRNNKFNDRNNKFNDRSNKFDGRNAKFNNNSDKFNSTQFNNYKNDDKKEEKLHPSWEAKRKLKSMSLLPSQGKKIVFNDN